MDSMAIASFSLFIRRLAGASAALIIALVPFHAFLTVWAGSVFGHYTAWRLWDEVLLGVVLLGAAWVLVRDERLRKEFIHNRLLWLIGAYILLQLLAGAVSFELHHVTLKALGYAWIVNLRFLLFFVAVWALASRQKLLSNWRKLLFVPLLFVIAVGLLQLVLPHDFLAHFGYGSNTIAPYETINHNQQYIRVQSTLRGANPLGAYLLIPISILGAAAVRRRNWRFGVLLLAAVAVLFFSFSRSAWLGCALSLVTIAGVLVPHSRQTYRWLAAGGIVTVALAIGLAVGLRHSAHFQNIIFHTQAHSAIKTTSDEGHASALASGLHDLLHEPLGRGPGTAGPASVYNGPHPARIAENYFVQIGQEVGWLGMAIFGAICGWVAYLLWQQRGSSFALGLFAGLLGITLVNLLSHAWTDDTVAYIWWGLAGACLAMLQKEDNYERSRT